VLVSFKQNGNFLLISVRNYGDLVPIHLRERLFQVLYRGRNAGRKKRRASGLASAWRARSCRCTVAT
jgi:signal transduction histidine kinase